MQPEHQAVPSPLVPILEHLRNKPSRTWSILITVFGDAVVPRGGSIGVGSLLGIFAGMGIGSGVVRTALSRLASDGWLLGERIGRNSFYKLTAKGRESFAPAAERIYGELPRTWNGRFHLVLTEAGPNQEAARSALEAAGFGSAAPGLWIAPAFRSVPPEAASESRIDGRMSLDTARRLVARVWPLADTASAYGHFVEAFTPLGDWIAAGGQLSDLDALVARILLIHEYRRVILRDPLLPLALLPEAWAGVSARELCTTIYDALLPASERWLDQNGFTGTGRLPPAGTAGRRFSRVPDDRRG